MLHGDTMKSFKTDLHIHTRESSPCGEIGARRLVLLYSQIGFSTIVITDHFFRGYFESLKGISWEEKIDCFMTGYKIALDEAKSTHINVLLGAEITFDADPNDYLVYGIDEFFLKNNPMLYEIGLEKFNSLIDKSKIMVFQAHPFREGMSPASSLLLDGMEVYNGSPRHNSNNDFALKHAVSHNLIMISGSDFHCNTDLGTGGIITNNEIKTIKQLNSLLMRNEDIKLIGI